DLSAPDVVPESYGSGVVIDSNGLVLTCAHVVRNATRVYVHFPGPRPLGSWGAGHPAAPRSDLAVLQLLSPPAGVQARELGRGEDVSEGKLVVCMSNAFTPGFRQGHEPTVAEGRVSMLRLAIPGDLERMPREKITLHHYGTLVRTTAQTTPGCS